MTRNVFSLAGMRRLKERELPEVRAMLRAAPPRIRALHGPPFLLPGIRIIAEIKKASPSRGPIRDVTPGEQAARYALGGAAALSVLTDNNYFSGSWEDLRRAAGSVGLPVLCKEFIFFEEQLDLAHLYGADMALLIAKALTRDGLKKLYGHALGLGLAPVVEVHRREELPAVLDLDVALIMVNLRDLDTLEIDFAAGVETLHAVPDGLPKICASGIRARGDIIHIFEKTGTRLFLVGTALMESGSPEDTIRRLSDVH